MTPSINYNHIHSTVETELHALQAEKAELQGQLKNIEQRLVEINLHEEKLQRVFDSLADLLSANDSLRESLANSIAQAINIATDNTEIADKGEPVATTTAREIEPTTAAAASEVETEAPGAELALSKSVGISAPASEAAGASAVTLPTEKNSETSVETAVENQGDSESTLPKEDAAAATPVTSSNKTYAGHVSDFNPADFFERFPHIQKTHPVNVLARKLLEYFDRGLKLGEIAKLIEALGYQHNSRNFTDTVHSALKNKRKTTGEFRFNAKKAVWELAHWPEPDKEQVSNAQTVKQSTATSTNRSDEKSIFDKQKSEEAKGGKTRRTSRGDANALMSRKLVSKNGISVYKRKM